MREPASNLSSSGLVRLTFVYYRRHHYYRHANPVYHQRESSVVVVP